jgi:hypothetical protein
VIDTYVGLTCKTNGISAPSQSFLKHTDDEGTTFWPTMLTISPAVSPRAEMYTYASLLSVRPVGVGTIIKHLLIFSLALNEPLVLRRKDGKNGRLKPLKNGRSTACYKVLLQSET